jgi:hypothetical protein
MVSRRAAHTTPPASKNLFAAWSKPYTPVARKSNAGRCILVEECGTYPDKSKQHNCREILQLLSRRRVQSSMCQLAQRSARKRTAPESHAGYRADCDHALRLSRDKHVARCLVTPEVRPELPQDGRIGRSECAFFIHKQQPFDFIGLEAEGHWLPHDRQDHGIVEFRY